jgi:hypothetical protein
MATALVSSAAGLLRAYYPEENANEIRRRVLNSADNINNVNSVYLNLLGSGRLNLFAAFEYNRLKFPVMKITPNPSAGKIEIDFNLVESGNYQISVFDVLGKLYHRECFFAQAKAYIRSFDLGHIKQGYYTIQLTSSEVNFSSGIIIVK